MKGSWSWLFAFALLLMCVAGAGTAAEAPWLGYPLLVGLLYFLFRALRSRAKVVDQTLVYYGYFATSRVPMIDVQEVARVDLPSLLLWGVTTLEVTTASGKRVLMASLAEVKFKGRGASRGEKFADSLRRML